MAALIVRPQRRDLFIRDMPDSNSSDVSPQLKEDRGIKVILFSDVVNSSGRMVADEAATVRLIERDLAIFAHHVEACGGDLVKNTGDGILAAFPTTSQALQFIQQSLRELHSLTDGPSLQHRFGLHIGEVYVKDSDIIGQAVHLAARLQTISPVNGVAFTEGTYANVDPHFRGRAASLGPIELKGFPEPIRCYAIHEASFLDPQGPSAQGFLSSPWAHALKRLRSSTPAQGFFVVFLLLIGLFSDLDPTNRLSSYLLNRRLHIQKIWREATAQAGPLRAPLVVVLLESAEPLIPRSRLAELLLELPPQRVPILALDLVLDQPGPDPTAMQRLADVISRQQRPTLYVGYYGPQAQATAAGRRSEPMPLLREAGVVPRNLAIGTAAGSGPVHPPPLQLMLPLSPDHLAVAIADAGASAMPADAVIDWSLAWDRMIRVESPDGLRQGRYPLVLVGRLSDSRQADADLFQTPAAFLHPDPLWGGSAHEMPGVILQAVVSQSLALRHWLMPLSATACSALAAGAGILLAALQPSRRRRLLLLLPVVPVAIVLSLQLAVSQRLLLPLTLPILALGGTSLLRRQ